MARDENIFDELQDYIEVYNRPTPIKYDLLRLSDEHRKFDALIRRYWKLLHPLSRDIFTSFANEFQYLIEELKKSRDKIDLAKQSMSTNQEELMQKFQTLEKQYEVKLIDEVAKIKSQTMDEFYGEINQLKSKITTLQEQLKNKEEINDNLRNEINLLIDDSDEQIQSTKYLEKNIQESIKNFDKLTKQLSILEKELSDLNQAKENATKQVEILEHELTSKEQKIDEVQNQYKSKIEETENKYHSLKTKIKQVSPNIEKLYSHSKAIENKNKLLEIQNQQLKEDNKEKSLKIIQLESRLETLRREFNALKDSIKSPIIKVKDNTKIIPVVIESDEILDFDQRKINIVKSKSTASLLDQINTQKVVEKSKDNSNIPILSKIDKKSRTDDFKNIMKKSIKQVNSIDPGQIPPQVSIEKNKTKKIIPKTEDEGTIQIPPPQVNIKKNITEKILPKTEVEDTILSKIVNPEKTDEFKNIMKKSIKDIEDEFPDVPTHTLHSNVNNTKENKEKMNKTKDVLSS